MTRTMPPDCIVERAIAAANKSPCAKSQRGVVIYEHGDDDTYVAHTKVEACNAQPSPFFCDRSDACRRDCSKLCLHAEQVAIERSLNNCDPDPTLSGRVLVHVKTVGGKLVAGGGPSCWQCSRMILAAELDGVWLYEGVGAIALSYGDSTPTAIGEWRYYTALEFHRATLIACGLHVSESRSAP